MSSTFQKGAVRHKNAEPKDRAVDNDVHCNGGSKNGNPPNPYASASFFSQLTFGWVYSLVKLGRQRALEDTDLATLMESETSVWQRRHMESVWENEIRRTTKLQAKKNKSKQERNKISKPSLARAIFWDYWRRSQKARVFLALNMASKLVQTMALGKLLGVLEADKASSNQYDGYIWSSVIVVCGLVAFPTKQMQFFETYRIGLQIHISLISSIYSKILRLPSIGLEASNLSSGHVTNLASNDVEKFIRTTVTSNFLLLGAFETVAILILGVTITGPSFLAGFVLLCLLVPLQFTLGRSFASYRRQIAMQTDARVSWISQAVFGARIMKQNAFEYLFLERITKQRAKEVDKLQKSMRLRAMNEAIYFFTSTLVATLIFSVHVLSGGQLTPQNVYTTLSLLNILQFTLTKHIPNAVMGLSECYISCKRIQAFFEIPETHLLSNTNKSVEPNPSLEALVTFRNVTCHWDYYQTNSETSPVCPALCEINADFDLGRLFCVIGSIGSGKSALLQAIANELPITQGEISRSTRCLSYAAQDPWIMDGTVKENILMGLAFDQEWYDQVIDACALRVDLASFMHGDATIVGDRGIQCSGGQKARIGLARAFYNRASELILLDDPLSAVDPKVAKTIFFSAIQRLGVQRSKCVVLITHQHQFAGSADECILMDSGRIACKGSFEDCVEYSKNRLGIASIVQVEEPEEIAPPSELIKTTPSGRKEEQKETRITGIVQNKTWLSYAKALGGLSFCFTFLLLFAGTQGSLLSTLILLGRWGDLQKEDQGSGKSFAIVIGATAALVLLAIVRAEYSFYTLLQGSKKLHDRMVWQVLRGPISFFDTNPLGRILNRFSADVGIVDEILPLTAYDFFVGAFMFLGSVATAMVVLPHVLAILPLLVWCFLRFRSIFVATTRELKRLEGLGRSPIYAMLSETKLGVATIRINASTEYMDRSFLAAHDAHSRAAWAFMAASRWFATQLDMLSFLLLATSTFTAIVLHYQGWFPIESTTLGLALTLLIQMSNTNFPWTVRQSAELTNQMVSVERILEFCELDSEADLHDDKDQKLPEMWPSQGNVMVENLSVRYRPGLPLVLEEVSFEIPARSKVGIVGRTGSGKSTLVQVLFRLLEAESGRISIDGVDISQLGLHRLRTGISVIPQDPTLFSECTIRENLDLFGKYSDASILEAIKDAHLEDWIKELPNGLDSVVLEGGSNFSVGQRQLLCLARAILSRNPILVLDEATANVDRYTDRLLHDTLAKSFENNTVIAIAHRLETTMHADMVLVMGDGKVLEHGPPQDLLADKTSHFAAMALHAGHLLPVPLDKKKDSP